MNIIGPSSVSVEAAQAWARKRNSHERFVNVAPLYWQIAPRYGIPPEIPYAQAGHETGWGEYGGVVPPEFHNWCGLKTRAGGSNSDPKAHKRFPDDETGVLAHVQHLARYAGAQSLPEGDELVDPRWGLVTKFTHEVEGLGGAWAPSRTYGNGIASLAADLREFANHGSWEPPMVTPYDHIIPGMIDVRSQLATATQHQGGVRRGPYERIPLSAKRGVVVHYRGVVTDVNAGLASFKSDATYHVGKNWASRGEAPILGSGIMYHIGIDGQGNVYLLRDLDRVLWHCGAWPQNENTLAIQLPLGGNQRATNKQLASLNRVVDDWLAFTKAPDSEVWGHQELSPTDCPGTLMTDFVKPYRNAPPAQPQFPESLCFTETGACITLGFLGYWRRLEAAGMAFLALGYPLEDERPETRLPGVKSVQRFERGWLVWEPGEPVPYDVRHATLSQIAVLEGDA